MLSRGFFFFPFGTTVTAKRYSFLKLIQDEQPGYFFFHFQRKSKENKEQMHAEICIR